MSDLKPKTYKFLAKKNGAEHGIVHEIKASTLQEGEELFIEKVKKDILGKFTFSEIVKEGGEEVHRKINL